MPHTCHAIKCSIPVPPRLLMCDAHWFAVPLHLRRAVWHAYVPGQERTKTPTDAYLQAAAQAIIAVAEQEGHAVAPMWRRLAERGRRHEMA